MDPKETRRAASVDSGYWWKECRNWYSDYKILLLHGGTKKSVCEKGAGVIERGLKALLCEYGLMSETNMSHNLKHLAIDAGVYDELSPALQMYLVKNAKMHNRASYPNDDPDECVWYNPTMFAAFIANTEELFKQILLKKLEVDAGANAETGGSADDGD